MAIWKDVVGYEGLYLVSDEGRIISLPKLKSNGDKSPYMTKERVLSPGMRDGYFMVKLVDSEGNTKSHAVHRIVAEAFLDNPKWVSTSKSY